MPIRVTSCIHAVSFGLFAAVIVLSTNHATFAADDCLTEPNRPAQGGHWYYHSDPATNRKCWYLVEAGARPPTADAPEAQPSIPPPQQTFGAFFSSLGWSIPGAQPDATTGDPRIVQAARPDEIKNDNRSPNRQTRTAQHPDAVAELTPKPHRPARPRPPAEQADERPAAAPNQAKGDALFKQFLQWKEHQTP
jgi:hypothetical protein